LQAPALGFAANVLNGCDDVGVGPATADVSAHAFPNISVMRAAGFVEQSDGGHDLPGRAIAALIGVICEKRRLHWMQRTGLSNAFYGRDLVALVHHSEAQARIHPPSIDVHRTGAALAVVTPFLRAGERDGFTQAIQERGPRIERESVLGSIDAQTHLHNGIRSDRILQLRG
jgi:hypothetical protein